MRCVDACSIHPLRSLRSSCAVALPARRLHAEGAQGRRPPGVPIVRVRLLEAQSEVTVASTESVAFREAPGVSPRPLNVPRKQPSPSAAPAPAGASATSTSTPASSRSSPSAKAALLSINGKPYRGDCRLVPVGAGKFDVVNDVDLEGYLKGVLAKELLRDWHEEAYKAQAIVARTYALYEMKTAGAGRHWDVHPDERSQVYGGVGGENGLSRTASDATAGVVVAYGPHGQGADLQGVLQLVLRRDHAVRRRRVRRAARSSRCRTRTSATGATTRRSSTGARS